MPSELATQVEQLAVVDGVKLDSAANILVGEHVSRLPFARARGRLYVLVEPIGERTGWEGICRELAQAVHDEYYDGSGSVTAGLRLALERANALLCEMNAAEARRANRLAGISAVVLKGNDAFIAQTGPALVYVVRKGTTTRFPEDSPWLDMSPQQAMEEGYAPPLGLRPDLSVDMFHCEVEPGDSIVLTESVAASSLSEGEIASLVAEGEGDIGAGRLQSLFKDKDVSLLVVKVGAPDQEMTDARRPPRLGPMVRLAGPTSEMPRPSFRPVESGGEPNDIHGLVRRAGAYASAGVAMASSLGSDIWRRMLPGSDLSRAARQRRRRSGALALLPQARRTQPDDRLVLVGILLAVAVVLAGGYGLVRWQTARVQAARYQRTLELAQSKLAEAKAATDPTSARKSLEEANVLLTRAEQYGRNDTASQELSQQLGQQLDALNKVSRLYWLPVLREYSDAGSAPRRVIAHGIDVYVEDNGLGRIYKYLFNPTMDGLQELGEGVPEVLMRTGDVRGDLTVGRIVDMTWMSAGPGRDWSSLLVLDQSGALLEYEPTAGIKVLPIGQRASLLEPHSIAGIEGRLLVLDAKANQILVFEPGAGGYDTAAKPYTNANLLLSGVVDMQVDGDVYLLYADGLVAKLRGGQQLPFDLKGLEVRIKNPTAMCVTPAIDSANPGHIYIADAGNQRILEFSKDGDFARQFLPKRNDSSFANITGLWVDEKSGKMLVLSNNKLLLANLPTE